jgi:hypothetical protein
MREDSPLCLRQTPFAPMTTNSHHSWCVVANLTRGMVLTGLDQLWVADIMYVHLAEEFGYLAVVLDAFSRGLPSSRMLADLARRASCRGRSTAPTSPARAASGSRSAIPPTSPCNGSGARIGEP